MKYLAMLISLVAFSAQAASFSHFSDSVFNIEKIKFSNKQSFPLESDGSIAGFGKKTIFITIDDGPVYNVTSHILDTLEEYDIPATFFMVGNRLTSKTNALLERMNSAGHGIANHSYEHHYDYPTQSSWIKSLMGTHEKIEPFIRRDQTWLFRAPGGVWNNWRTNISNEHAKLRQYVGPIFWNAGGGADQDNDADWKCWSKKVSVSSCAGSYYDQIMNNYRRGRASLVLFHDINMNSAHMIRQLIERLKSNGVDWDFRLVEEIPAVKALAPRSI